MLWRSSPRRRSPPKGFVIPCQPTLVAHPPTGADWLHEVKHDGFGILARKQGERVKIWSRRGADFTDRFSRIAESVRGLPADEALIDGEAVVFQDDGRSDFHALLTKRGGAQASLLAFDLLRRDGEDMRLWPIEARREALLPLVARRRGDAVVYSEALQGEGALVYMKACALGLEGIVSKRAGSLYKSGPSRNWLKTKNPDFVRT